MGYIGGLGYIIGVILLIVLPWVGFAWLFFTYYNHAVFWLGAVFAFGVIGMVVWSIFALFLLLFGLFAD